MINPFGLLYSEITASSLIKVDLSGTILHHGSTGDTFGINRAGYVIHSAIHEARHDIKCVMHCHFIDGSGVSCTNEGLITSLSQTSQIVGEIAYHEYEGIAVNESEKKRLVSDLGVAKVLILRNHGLVTCGASIAEACFLMYNLVTACRIQTSATSNMIRGPESIYPVNEEISKLTTKISNGFNAEGFGMRELCANMRILDRVDPGYRN